jgi:hypothetical protein
MKNGSSTTIQFGGPGGNRKKASRAEAEARGKAKVRPRAQPPLEEVRTKSQKGLETNHWIIA